jgi:hypothetical protein
MAREVSPIPQPEEFLFIVENMRIGGIQRLVLDECYRLIQLRYKASIISLSPKSMDDSILEVDSEFPLVQKISITYLESNKLFQLKHFCKLIRSNPRGKLITSHSASAVPLLRIASIISRKRINLTLYIHQLMTLSDTKQKMKRFVYSLFANEITFSSNQFLLDWNVELDQSKFHWVFHKKKMRFDRMGVYLPRLEWGKLNGKEVCDSRVPHLVFMSRISTWKGSQDFTKICDRNLKQNLHAIAFVSPSSRKELFDPTEFSSETAHVLYTRGLTNTLIDPNSVHIYPSNYGPKVRFPQSIGMNVLEMIANGIPSLISEEGFESWPELRDSLLVQVVNWDSEIEVDKAITSALNLSIEERRIETQKLLKTISIEQHVDRIVKRSKGN